MTSIFEKMKTLIGRIKRKKIVVCIDREIKDLIPGYMEHVRQNLEQTSSALAQRDYTTIEDLGHRLRGTGGEYGFKAITEAGRRIEAAAEACDSEAIQKPLLELKKYLDNLEITYE